MNEATQVTKAPVVKAPAVNDWLFEVELRVTGRTKDAAVDKAVKALAKANLPTGDLTIERVLRWNGKEWGRT